MSATTDTVPISAAGYERRRRELDELRETLQFDIPERLRLARAQGKLADNAELQDLLAEQAQLGQRAALLAEQLAVAEVVEPSGSGRVEIGSRVRFRDGDGREHDYELVGPLEADVVHGRVSINAPVGRALFGRRRGARVDVPTPGGVVTLQITSIRHGRRAAA